MPEAAALSCVVVRDAADGPQLLSLTVTTGTTVEEVVRQAYLAWSLPAPVSEQARTGIWGKECSPGQRVAEGDRIELYRDLPNDPKLARRQRARAASRLRRPAR